MMSLFIRLGHFAKDVARRHTFKRSFHQSLPKATQHFDLLSIFQQTEDSQKEVCACPAAEDKQVFLKENAINCTAKTVDIPLPYEITNLGDDSQRPVHNKFNNNKDTNDYSTIMDYCEKSVHSAASPKTIDNSSSFPQSIQAGRQLFRVFALLALLAFSPVVTPALAQEMLPGMDSTDTSTIGGDSVTAPSNTTSSTNTASGSCMTCAALQTYIDKTQGFSDNLANVLSGPMNIIFASMAGFWAVMCGFRLAISSVDGKTLAKEALWVMVAAVLLGTKGTTLISTAYTDSITVMGSAAGAVFSIASTASVSGDGMQGMTALAANGEKALTTIFQIVGALAGKGGVTDGSLITNTIYAIILGFPYVILMIFYAAHIVIAIFRATMVGLFAPLLFMALGFSQTRDMAISGAKVLLGSILVLFAVTAALSLSIYGVTSTITIDPKTIVAGTSDNFASITSANYIVALFMGWAGVAFLAEGASIANAIAGAGLTETATAIMTGALAMAMKGLSKMIGNPIGAGLAKVGGAALGGAGNQAKRLVDAFKNINKS